MARFWHPVTGVIVSVADGKSMPAGFRPAGDGDRAGLRPGSKAAGYADMTVVKLREEITARNKGREADVKVPGDGNKEALIAALEADDKATSTAPTE